MYKEDCFDEGEVSPERSECDNQTLNNIKKVDEWFPLMFITRCTQVV